ncbi:P-loop ATPase, partial [archaeon]|nr:P-loop ATPase [archaeon]
FENNKPELKQFSCEGCGACELVCAKDAITLVNVDNAKIGYAKTKYDFKVVSAQLGIGESGSGKVVSAVKELGDKLSENSDFMLIDAAAGIGCPVIASVTGSDYVIAITEPTPSGFSDLKRALKMVNHFKIPKSVIINKYDINLDFSKKIEKYLIENNLKLTSKIKYDKSFSDALMNLVPVIEQNEEFLNVFQKIYVDLSKEIF